MPTLVIVCACLFYACVGGCAYYELKNITVRVDDGTQVPPVCNTVCLPDEQFDTAQVFALSMVWSWETVPLAHPNAARQAFSAGVFPVIYANIDSGGLLTLAIGNNSSWSVQSMTNVFACDQNGVPEFTSMGETSPGVAVNLMYSPDLVTWTNLVTVNVDGETSYVDDSHPLNIGNGFYAAWY